MTTSSLGNSIANEPGSVAFPCPKCLGSTIVRSRNERANAAKYTCASCGFVGPN